LAAHFQRLSALLGPEAHLLEQIAEFGGDLRKWVAGEGRRNQALRLAQGTACDGQGRGAAVEDGAGMEAGSTLTGVFGGL